MFWKRVILILVAAVSAVHSAWTAEWRIEDAIAGHITESRPSAVVKVESVMVSGDLPQGPPIRIQMTAGVIPGRATFSLIFPGGRNIHATAMVRLSEKVVMPRRGLEKGHTLREEDLYETFMDATRIPKNAVPNIAEVAGRKLSRSVLPNAVITDDMIFDAAVVRSGATVALIFETPGFVIRTTGELRQRAKVGEYVKVMNVTSRKILTGLLVDEGTVKVDL